MIEMSKIAHFSFLAIFVLLIGRLIALSSLSFSYFWLVFAFIAFATVYFPFTPGALDFYHLSLKEKTAKFFKRAAAIDTTLGVIASVPYLFCYIGWIILGASECYAGILSIGAWIGVGILIGAHMATLFLIYLMHFLERISPKTRYLIFGAMILILIFLNLYPYLIPGSKLAYNKNAFFAGTNQCEKLDIFDFSQNELAGTGCHSFYMFDKNGEPLDYYKNLAPINAFPMCSYKAKIIDCGSARTINDAAKYPESIDVYTSGYKVIPIEYLDQYGISKDVSYFEACKVILADYVEKKKKECLNNL